jgi:myo-inositol-1(or 4)-monophosphatase
MAQTFTEAELKDIYTFALDLGRRAGKILVDGVEKRTGAAGARDMGKQEEKMNAVDIVTQTDLGMSPFNCEESERDVDHVNIDVEAFVKDEINRKYPDHKFVILLVLFLLLLFWSEWEIRKEERRELDGLSGVRVCY